MQLVMGTSHTRYYYTLYNLWNSSIVLNTIISTKNTN